MVGKIFCLFVGLHVPKKRSNFHSPEGSGDIQLVGFPVFRNGEFCVNIIYINYFDLRSTTSPFAFLIVTCRYHSPSVTNSSRAEQKKLWPTQKPRPRLVLSSRISRFNSPNR